MTRFAIPPDEQSMGQYLTEKREERGWSQRELADRAQTGQSMVSRYELDKVKFPELAILERIEEVLELPPGELKRRSGWARAKAWANLTGRYGLATDPLHALWRFLLDSGVRIGEAQALTWRHVTLEQSPLVRIERTVTDDEAGRETIGREGKTFRSRREIPIETETAEAIAVYRRQQRERGQGWQDDDFVFADADGAFLRYTTLRKAFHTACRQADVPYVGFHGLRRTMTTTWMRAGINPRIVADRLGHQSVAVTLNTYAVVDQDWQSESMARIAEYRQEAG